jgi:hypothetical protein
MAPDMKILVLLLIALATSAWAALEGEVTVRSADVTATLTAKAGWTITALDYAGTRLIVPAGGQGAVALARNGDWAGSAMKGGEVVSDFAATVDGAPADLSASRALSGRKIVLTKTSTFGGLAHTATTTFEDGTIYQTHSFRATADLDLADFYPFIYSCAPTMTDWLAGMPGGARVEGAFTTSKQQLLNRKALWVAEYNTTAGKGLVFHFVTPLAGGDAAVRLWDQADYRKFFFEPVRGKIPAGTAMSFTLVMRPFTAAADAWKQQAADVAQDLQKQFPAQEPISAAPRLYDEGVPEEGQLTARTAHYKVVLSARQAWTIFTLDFDDKPVGQATGFYGTVMIPNIPGGNFIGTGHTEGGREVVHALTLTVDGAQVPVQPDLAVTGHRIELVKDSTIYKFRARTTITVCDDQVVERQELEATEHVNLRLMYLFMHCWTSDSTQWCAELPDGSFTEGSFNGEGFELNRDSRWCAQYIPTMSLSILGYTPRVAAGPHSQTMLWDLPRYHKFYTRRTEGGESFTAGDKLDYTMIVKAVPTETGDWTATKAAAAALKQQWPPAEGK